MSIKFLTDDIRIKDREELQNIVKNLKEHPVKADPRAYLLRRFTLAAIDTFRTEKHYTPEIHDINISTQKIPIKQMPNNLIPAPDKIDVPLDLFLNAPEKIDVPEELLEEAPKHS